MFLMKKDWFHKPPVNGVGINRSNINVLKKNLGDTGVGNSFVHVVKGSTLLGSTESDSPPVIVLDSECVNSKDLSYCLLGRVKVLALLSNLKMALTNEGFVDITIHYMGELWVMLEFTSANSKVLFQDNVGAKSWFSKLIQASTDFNTDGRIVWVEIKGIPFKLWSGNTFKRIASRWGEVLDTDDQEDICFHSKRLCIHTRLGTNIFEAFKINFRGKTFWIRAKEVTGWVPDFLEESEEEEDQSEDGSKNDDPKSHDLGSYGGDSDVEEVPDTLFMEKGQRNDKLDEESTGQKVNQLEDPFGIYPMLNKKRDTTDINNNSEQRLKFSPCFTPNEDTDVFSMNVEDARNVNCVFSQEFNVEEVNNGPKDKGANVGSKIDVAESLCLGHFKKSEMPRIGGSILNLMEELVKVGQTMGYNMDGCLAQKAEKDWVKELCGKHKVNFLALQETKIENMEIFSVKTCWGNFAFDYVHSDSVVWLKTGKNLLIVAVYAPHDLKDKRMPWDYLVHEITKWHGEVVIMGDFNEVRYKSDRFGLVFNVQGANVFNSFIANAGLEEVPL
ncbi:RNA-directed DNA polymerase, eukaryota, partial [Tanacetum coccineum]